MPTLTRNVDSRYQLGCECCGFIWAWPRFEQAAGKALEIESRHQAVTIFDTMARHGQPQLWAANGDILEIRP